MKEIRRTKLVEVEDVKFIANDGKEFTGDNAEKECIDYERNLDRERVEKEFKKLNPRYIELPCVEWFCFNAEIVAVTVNNEYDYEVTLKDHFYHCCDFVDWEENKPKSFPQDIIVLSNYDYAWIWDKIQMRKELQKALEQMEQVK